MHWELSNHGLLVFVAFCGKEGNTLYAINIEILNVMETWSRIKKEKYILYI